MKIISWNVNGIRAVERKGELQKFLDAHNPDIFLIQETKAKAEQLSDELKAHPEYHQFYNSAEKPGYAGTAIWVKQNGETFAFTDEFPGYDDDEGRVARVDFGDWSVLGIYFPNGGKSPEAWQEKLVFYEKFLQYMNELRSAGRKVIWGGDVNCAHEEVDLARPKDNDGKIGFHPDERAWVSRCVDEGWTDAFRSLHPEKIIYSWWHLISKARARNVGWRIDYFFIDEALLDHVKNIEYLNDQMGSDHCPVVVEINI